MADRDQPDRHPDILDDVPMAAPDEPKRWLDHPGNLKKISWAVIAISFALIAIDPLIHKHGYFEIENWVGFYGFFAFLGCVGLVLCARELRKAVMRPEAYYDREDAHDR